MRTPLLACGLVVLLGCNRETAPPPPATTATGSSAQPAESAKPATTAKPATEAAEVLVVGSAAPDFSVKAHDGTAIQPSALKGRPIVLYFYPRDETPGCTKEACAFRDAWKDFEPTKVVLVGISTDTNESHKKFAENRKLPFHLVSDADGSIAGAYGVPNNAGFLARHTIVIGADGNVKKIYRSVDVSKHAAEVLADVKS
ncbi:MAG: peroxiredoxin [Labilithrix sp.]|nr:peroxiredoxin [Labilithrix sp.]MBX3224111.1 peroxiredoxin [Labilithrix sp.]